MTRQPVHYSIARIDIIEFERLCTQKIADSRIRTDYFNRCQQALQLLLDKGASDAEYAPNLLPYRYRDGEKFSSLLAEADMPSFGHVEGFRPTILIDTSGAVGEALPFIRSALKRMLYSFLVAKSKFNFVRFSPQGKPVVWADGMVPPTTQVLREAEEFLDSLQTLRANSTTNLLDGIKLAMADHEADSIFVLTPGLSRRTTLVHALRSVRESNVRSLPLHIIGVQCEARAELDLRKLAEDNQGSFRHKRFGVSSVQDAAQIVRDADRGDERLTIAAQMSITQIMIDEQERHTVDWLEEAKCANRLLFSSATQQAVPSAEQVQDAYQRSMHNYEKRVYGQSKSGLREACESDTPRKGYPPAAIGFLGAGAERKRVAEKARQRAGSHHASLTDMLRRPSATNPWDCPGDATRSLKPCGPTPGPRPPRTRPSSASRARTQRQL
jgi:hypothetical protein